MSFGKRANEVSGRPGVEGSEVIEVDDEHEVGRLSSRMRESSRLKSSDLEIADRAETLRSSMQKNMRGRSETEGLGGRGGCGLRSS